MYCKDIEYYPNYMFHFYKFYLVSWLLKICCGRLALLKSAAASLYIRTTACESTDE